MRLQIIMIKFSAQANKKDMRSHYCDIYLLAMLLVILTGIL